MRTPVATQAASVRRSMALLREMVTGPEFAEGRALAERRPPEF